MTKRYLFFLVALWLLSVVLFYSQQFFFGVICLTASFVLWVGKIERCLVSFTTRHEFHFILTVEIYISSVLDHPTVHKIFETLKNKQLLERTVSFDQWKKELLENYHKNDIWTKRIRFDVKDNVVWKNLKFYPGSSIEHTAEAPIPFFDQNQQNPPWKSWFPCMPRPNNCGGGTTFAQSQPRPRNRPKFAPSSYWK